MERPPKIVIRILFAGLSGLSFLIGLQPVDWPALLMVLGLMFGLLVNNYLVIINMDGVLEWEKIIPLTFKRTARHSLSVVVPLGIGMTLQGLRLFFFR